MNTTLKILLISVFAFLVTSCNYQTAAQIKAEGQKYQTELLADQTAQNMAQERLQDSEMHNFEVSKKEYWKQVRSKWQGTIVKLGTWFLYSMFMVVVVGGLALSRGAWIVIDAGANSMAQWMTIRSNLIPIDPQTRLARPFMHQLPQSSNSNTWTDKIENALGINIKHSRFKSEWSIVDVQTSRVITKLNENAAGDVQMKEINREVLLASVMLSNMRKTGLVSSHGEVAEAMANTDIVIPGQPLTDETTIKKYLEDLIEGYRDAKQ